MTSTNRVWGIMSNPDMPPCDRLQDYFQEGAGDSAIDYYKFIGMILKTDSWYYILLWVRGPSEFSVRIWEKDNPDNFAEAQFNMVDSENWTDRNWSSNLFVTAGTLEMSNYTELVLPKYP